MDPASMLLQYSNAVLIAILPQVSDFASKLELRIQTPITTNHVRYFGGFQGRDRIGGHLVLTNGFEFWYDHGHVQGFASQRSYYIQQDPRVVPQFYGQLRMTKQEIIQLARSALRKLGYSEEQLYADLEPKVEGPDRVGKNVIPHYNIEWMKPLGGSSLEVEVDAGARAVRAIWFFNRNLWRPDPPINVPKPAGPWWRRSRDPDPPPRLERSAPFLLKILPEIEQFARRLDLPLTYPLTYEQVKEFKCTEERWGLAGKLELKNGYSFRHNYGFVEGFSAPDVFFTFEREVRIRDFVGEFKMTEEEAVALAREAIRKLGYSADTSPMDQPPTVGRPEFVGSFSVPRYSIGWGKASGSVIVSCVIVEIDAGNRKVKSVLLSNPPLAKKSEVGPQKAHPKNQPMRRRQ